MIAEINIADLLLDTSNPRFLRPVESQREALLEIVRDQGDKLLSLADSLSKGFYNHENLVVTPYGDHGQYLVREGNRRTATLKILNNPSLIENEFPNLAEKMKAIVNRQYQSPMEKVPCTIETDEGRVREILILKHNGELGGKGTVEWNTIQRIQNNIYIGVNNEETDILTYLLSLELDDEVLRSLTFTNVSRILQSPYVKNKLGILSYKQSATSDGTNSINKRVISKIVRDFSGTNPKKVEEIYNTEKRIEYFEEVYRSVINTPTVNGDPAHNNGGSNTDNENQPPTNNSRPKNKSSDEPKKTSNSPNPKSTSRKYLIPKSCNIKINHSRINNIYNELRSISVDTHPNACSVLLRVFVELTLDRYYAVVNQNSLMEQKKLKEKFRVVVEQLKEKGLLNKHQINVLNKIFGHSESVCSIETWNTYVHNPSMNPSATDLKTTWDNIEEFMIILHEEIEKLNS